MLDYIEVTNHSNTSVAFNHGGLLWYILAPDQLCSAPCVSSLGDAGSKE